MWTRIKRMGDHGWLRWLFSGFLFLVSIGILGGMVYYYGPTILSEPLAFQLVPLVLGFGVYSLDLLLVIVSWGLIMSRLANGISFREHLRIYCLTLFTRRIPGAPWHFATRAMAYKQLGVEPVITTIATGLETLLITATGFFVCPLIWFILPDNLQSQLRWIFLVLIPCLAMVHPKVVAWIIKRFGKNEIAVGFGYTDLLVLLGEYILVWGVGGIVLYALILALYPLPPSQIPGVLGAWALSGAIASIATFTPTSFGIREVSLGLLLAIFIPPGLALIVAILSRLFLTGVELFWALVASRL